MSGLCSKHKHHDPDCHICTASEPSQGDPEAPQKIVSDWIKDCSCCPECSHVPCDGVMAGGMCDQLCDCSDNEDDEHV